ncbi:hypothetical protein [Micromonospora sp. NPDC005652]|uniref:hypothetical protein n=1 Tax=Micromonospora sp. NPDC005652 TaxID=3157046 RepID=UPI0034041094
MPYKVFTTGSVLTAGDLNDYLMKQSVIACTSGSRPASPVEGMVIVETDTDQMFVYSGSAWRWVASYGSNAVGTASATATQTTTSTAEIVSLTIPNMVFRAERAYRAHIRTSVYGAAGEQAFFRLRKTNTSGDDWGEFARVTTGGTVTGFAAMANGTIILVRSASTDLTATVVLTVSSRSGGQINLFASAATPRYLVIEPIGSAADYAGLGVDVA